MIILMSAILGALYGVMVAKKRGESGADLTRSAIVQALIFAAIGVVVTLINARMAG